MIVTTKDNDGSLPPPPRRPTYVGEDHDAIRAFRKTTQDIYRLLVRLVNSGHIDDTTLTLLGEITQKGTALHAYLDDVDAAWIAANIPAESSATCHLDAVGGASGANPPEVKES